jgi:hypothetical protein
MSDFAGLTVISFFGVLGFSLFFHMSTRTNDMGTVIHTGVVDNTPLSIEQRWFMLYRYATHGTAVVACGVFLALAQVQFANYVDDANVKLLAHLAAFLAAVGGFGWLVQGAATLFKYQSLLRRAEASRPRSDEKGS